MHSLPLTLYIWLDTGIFGAGHSFLSLRNYHRQRCVVVDMRNPVLCDAGRHATLHRLPERSDLGRPWKGARPAVLLMGLAVGGLHRRMRPPREPSGGARQSIEAK